MSTPAEIIAARYSAEPEEQPVSSSIVEDENLEPVPQQKTKVSTPSLADESSFPTLGGGSGVISTPTWVKPGSAPQKAAVSAPSSFDTPKLSSNGGYANGGSKPLFKSSTIQDAFSLDVEDQLNVTRPEFIKILTSIKSDTKTNIECTTSQHTKKRTFLITGKPQDVHLAKRLVIKKLTRPVKISFTIPAKIRSKVIGPQGKVLKPIVQANEVRVDIGDVEATPESESNDDSNVDNDDELAQTVVITIEGDVEGCKHAKAQILAVVREATKNLTTKISLDQSVKPFASKTLDPIVQQYSGQDVDVSIPEYNSGSNSILLSGERSLVLEIKSKFEQELASLSSRLTIESVPIPKVKQQFLPIKEILNKYQVLIKLPEEGETDVKFIGEKKMIKEAQEESRKTTSQYKVEVLDMSKAHKGNIAHVKSVALFLTKIGKFKSIGKENEVVIHAPTASTLQSVDQLSIPIEIISKDDQSEHTKNAKRAIVSVVNKISPDVTKVVEDIDEFFIKRVPETIDTISKQLKVDHVILNNRITLFSNEEPASASEDDDFEDFVDESKALESLNKVDEALNSLRQLTASLDRKVLSIKSTDQDAINGPNGTTLKSILREVPENTVSVKLHSNGETTSEDEVFVQGTKAEVATVVKEIEQVLKDGGASYTTSLEFPSFILSRFIGKNGSNLNSFQDEFYVKIDVDNKDSAVTSEAEDKSAKTQITVTGLKKNSEACKVKIIEFGKRWADETLVRVRVEEQYHRKIIGAAGVYINRLQDKYHVKIRFPLSDGTPSSFADAPKHKDEVTIKGPSRGVAKAEEELKDLYQFEKENGFKQLIQIPSKAISRVIGKAGETINDIADGTGVEYKFNRDKDEKELGYIDLELTGSKAALKNAIAKIDEIIEEAENFVSVSLEVDPKFHKYLIGQGGSVMREIIAKAGGENIDRKKFHGLLIIPDAGSGSNEVVSKGDKSIVDKVIEQVKAIVSLKERAVVEEYELAKEKHRLVVGTGGSVRQSLQDKYNVTINVPKPDSKQLLITLEGLPEDIENLKVELGEITKDDWNESIEVPAKYHALVSERGAIFGNLKNDYSVEVQHGPTQSLANKLSKSKVPQPPQEASQGEGSNKFTIVEGVDYMTGSEGIIVWRLKGEKADTAKAAKYIESRLKAAEAATSTGWYYFANPTSVSKIIGARGSTLNRIRKASNCFINVPKANDDGQVVYLIGNEAGLTIAQKEIEKASPASK